jgi:hypothetical protein
MRLQTVLAVLGNAGVTMVLTVMLLAPRGVGAVNGVPRIKPEIAQPRLTSHGCLFALKTDKADYEAGDRPSIEIAASNPTEKPADATVWINILATRPTSPLSRMLPTPRSLWSHPQAFRLKARETKTVTVVSEASLPAGEKISITMSDRNEAILARSLGVRNGPATASPSSPAAKAARTEP